MQDFFHFLGQHYYLVAAICTILTLLLIVEIIRNRQQARQLSTTQAIQMINHDHAIVLDIRNSEQYAQGHIIDAVAMPAIEVNGKKLEKYKTKPLIIVCQNGTQAQKIATQLQKQGYNAFSLAGGLRNWLDVQLPIVKN